MCDSFFSCAYTGVTLLISAIHHPYHHHYCHRVGALRCFLRRPSSGPPPTKGRNLPVPRVCVWCFKRHGAQKAQGTTYKHSQNYQCDCIMTFPSCLFLYFIRRRSSDLCNIPSSSFLHPPNHVATSHFLFIWSFSSSLPTMTGSGAPARGQQRRPGNGRGVCCGRLRGLGLDRVGFAGGARPTERLQGAGVCGRVLLCGRP